MTTLTPSESSWNRRYSMPSGKSFAFAAGPVADGASHFIDGSGVSTKRHRVQMPELTLVPVSPLWKIGEDARAAFDKLSGGSDVLCGPGIAALAAELRWPTDPSPLFLSLVFAVYSNTPCGERMTSCLKREAWIVTFQSLGATSVVDAAQRMWDSIRSDYRNPKHAALFSAFHRFVFVFLLLHQDELESRSSPTSQLNHTSEKLSCVDPGRQQLGTFRRAISINVARLGIVAVLSQLSPYALSFCAFLDSHQLKRINLDQWINIAMFSRVVSPSGILRHSISDCWPTLIDDYVEWLKFTSTAWQQSRHTNGRLLVDEVCRLTGRMQPSQPRPRLE